MLLTLGFNIPQNKNMEIIRTSKEKSHPNVWFKNKNRKSLIKITIQYYLRNPLVLGSKMCSPVCSYLSSSKSKEIFQWNKSFSIASSCASSFKSIFPRQVVIAKMREKCSLSMSWKLHALNPSPFIVIILWNIVSMTGHYINALSEFCFDFLFC